MPAASFRRGTRAHPIPPSERHVVYAKSTQEVGGKAVTKREFARAVTVYNRYVAQYQGTTFKIQDFIRFLRAVTPDSTIEKIATKTGRDPLTVKHILLAGGIRTQKEITRVRYAQAARSMMAESQLGGVLEAETVKRLHDPTKSLARIAREVGISRQIAARINRAHKIRVDPHNFGNKAHQTTRNVAKRKEIESLLKERTREGQYKYTARDVVDITETSRGMVDRIAKLARGKMKDNERPLAPSIAESRRNTFIERALKHTFAPRERIAQKALEREKRFGGKLSLQSMKDFTTVKITELKKQRKLKGRRFFETMANEEKAGNAFWKNPQPIKTVNFILISRRLKMPVYFVRKIFLEQMPIWAERMFEADNSDIYEISEKTGLPIDRLEEMRKIVWRRKFHEKE